MRVTVIATAIRIRALLIASAFTRWLIIRCCSGVLDSNPLTPRRVPVGATGFRSVDGGYGLAGMRERLLLIKGSLRAGVDDQRWIVRAQMPDDQDCRGP